MFFILGRLFIFVADFKHKVYDVMSMLLIIIVLFILAILSPWIFPNRMVSDNEHDKEA